MIECEYQIERNEGNETITYKIPKEFRKLPNIVHIEGPNDAGKSTLLNMVALAMYGNKNKNMNPALKDRIDGLVNSDYQKITFAIKITDAGNTLELVSEKDKFNVADIKVYQIEGGQKRLLSFEIFEKKYNLIYDIPNNPIGRLKQLISDVRDAQLRYGEFIVSFKSFLREQINDVGNLNNVELVARYIQKKKDFEEELKSINIQSREKRLELLKNYYYFRAYKELEKSLSENMAASDDYRKKLKNSGYKENGDVGSDYRNMLNDAVNRLSRFEKLYKQMESSAIMVAPKEINKLEKVDFKQIIKNQNFPISFDNQVSKIKKTIKETKEAQTKDKKAYSQVLLFDELIDVLENYRSLNMNLPGTNLSIEKFLRALNEEKEKMKSISEAVNNVNQTLSLLEKIEQEHKEINNVFFKIEKFKEQNKRIMEMPSEPAIMAQQLQNMEVEQDELQRKFDIVKGEYIKLGEPDIAEIKKLGEYTIFERLNLEQLEKEFKNLEDVVKQNKEKEKNLSNQIVRYEEELKDLEKKKVHKYSNNLDEMTKLFDVVEALEAEINVGFGKFVKKFTDGEKLKLSDLSKTELEYNNVLSKYLAKKIRFVTYIDKNYEIENVDLVTEIITTKEGKQIRLKDMGTGHTQSGYLKGKLSTQDDRKIIALFDEVGMIDSNSLGAVYERLKELHDEKKLIVGIVVQRGEKLNIISKT